MINCRMKKLKCMNVVLCIASLLTLFPQFFSFKVNADNTKHGKIVVSLGDSYSSGEGIEPFYGQDENISKKVNNPDWLAHRSKKSWPGMLTFSSVDGTMAENRNVYWYFAASSGATTEHMLNEQSKEYSKDFRFALGLSSPGFLYSDCYSIAPQLDIFESLNGTKVDYVTLTLGGNDANFSEIIKDAVLGSSYLNLSNLSNKINNTWEDFYKEGGICEKLQKAYQDISKKAGPQAKIIVAGYPQLLDPNGNGFFFSREEALTINRAVSYFNTAIKNIVDQCRTSTMLIYFVSVEDAFKGHEAYSDNPYINKVILGASAEELKDIAITSDYSMHPNYRGARAYAKCVQEKINELERLGFSDNTTDLETTPPQELLSVSLLDGFWMSADQPSIYFRFFNDGTGKQIDFSAMYLDDFPDIGPVSDFTYTTDTNNICFSGGINWQYQQTEGEIEIVTMGGNQVNRISSAGFFNAWYAASQEYEDYFMDLMNTDPNYMTQTAMNMISYRIASSWRAIEEYLCNELLETMSLEERNALRAEESAWVSEKDELAAAAGAPYEGGTMQPLVISTEKIRLYKLRVEVLLSYL